MLEGYYINLDKREDRKNNIEYIINKYTLFSNIIRFSAIKNTNGAIGCAMSHYTLLCELEKNTSNENNYIILEDDFLIFNESNFNMFVNDYNIIKNDDWDLIVLTPRGDTVKNYNKYINNNFYRIENNQTATGYIIKKHFIPILKKLFKIGLENMLRGESPEQNALDQIWKSLQKDNIFLYYKFVFAGQMPGYSDIEKRVTNYNGRFLNQSLY